jgi:hypothetical protein
MTDVSAFEDNSSRCRFEKPNDGSAYRSLSAPALPNETENLTPSKTERDTINGVNYELLAGDEPLNQGNFYGKVNQ